MNLDEFTTKEKVFLILDCQPSDIMEVVHNDKKGEK